MTRIIAFLTCLFLSLNILAEANEPPKILVVIAHPDDEVAFAATLYKATHKLNALVDVVMITNGEAGYKYATLAEPVYCADLTNESIAREKLPFIRKQETLNAGKILGVRNYYFLEQNDTGFTLDPQPVLNSEWDHTCILRVLEKLWDKNHYDYLFTLLPVPETHGHHKAATIMALYFVNNLKNIRPVILSAPAPSFSPPPSFIGLPDFPLTATLQPTPFFTFDKLQGFGYQNKLNYQIVVNWVIAEHKSQGTVQLLTNKGSHEYFYSYQLNTLSDMNKAKAFFDQLKD